MEPTEVEVTEHLEPVIPSDTGLRSQSGLTKLSEFISDVLSQLSFLQGVASGHITEIGDLQTQIEDQKIRIEQLEGFNRYLKTKLRAAREPGI